MRLTRTGASSSARLAVRAGSAAVTVDAIPRPTPGRRPPVPPMNSSVPPGLTLPAAWRAAWGNNKRGSAGGGGACSHSPLGRAPEGGPPAAPTPGAVVGGRQLPEEALEGGRIGGVEGRGAQRTEFARGVLEALGIPAGEDQVGPLSACSPGGFEPDAGAATDHDDGLPQELGFARGR